jgi:hypothetical protein
MTGYIIDYAKRNWQSYCIYLLFKDGWNSIQHQLESNKRHTGRMIELKNFENGRERGYTISDHHHGLEISWAEYRSSDDIVVYPFKWEDAINNEDDKSFDEKRKYFKREQFYEVYNFILKYLDIDVCEHC